MLVDRPAEGGPKGRKGRAGLALLLFALTVAVRALPWPDVLPPEGFQPPEPDAYYHLRRIEYGVERFPDLLAWDAYLAFPNGAKVIWPPAFDWTLAAAARLAVGTGDRPALERFVAWAPPLLAGLTTLAVYVLGRRFFGVGVGLGAGLLLAFLPAHASYSQVGFVDHHVAVSLLATLLLLAAMSFVRPGPASAGAWGARIGALGLLLGGIVSVWPGALLHVGVVDAGLAAWLLLSGEAGEARRRAVALAGAHALAFAVLAPFALGQTWERWGSMTPLVLSNLQPLWFAAATGCFAGLALVWRGPLGASRPARVGTALALGAAAAGFSLILAPALREQLVYAGGWFGENEAFLGRVAELRPLFEGPRGFDPGAAERMLTRLVWGVPVFMVALAWRTRHRGEVAPTAVFLLFVAALCAATLDQQRFRNSLSPAYSLLVAAGIAALLAPLRAHLANLGSRWLPAAGVLGLALLAFAFAPVFDYHAPHLRNNARVLGGGDPLPSAWWRLNRARARTAAWLGAHSPPTSGFLDPSVLPEYGVLSSWSEGHAIRYLARRPVVQDGFGVYGSRRNFELAEAYFAATDERTALDVAEEVGVRYVVVRRSGSGQGKSYGSDSMLHALYTLRGVGGELRSGARQSQGVQRPALRHHRLVFESEPYPSMAGGGMLAFRVFEIVPGARLVGSAPPGRRVEARLALRSGGVDLEYRQETIADGDGRYELVLPHATGREEGGVTAADLYRLESGGTRAGVPVSEAAVRRGERVEAPAFGG